MAEQTVPDTSNLLLSDADPELLNVRLRGGEFLLNHMLTQATDDNLPATVYLMHDWVLANKDQFKSFAKYADQPKAEIDAAIALFAENRRDICAPAKPGEFPLLQLYLLYDCMLHVGCLKRQERAVGYLSGRFNQAKSIGVEDFLQYGTAGQIYNYVRRGGEIRIASKNYYHSEIADGHPVQGAGEIQLTRNADDRVKKVRLNYFTGHYRVTADSMDDVVRDVEGGIKQQCLARKRPRVFTSENPLNKCAI